MKRNSVGIPVFVLFLLLSFPFKLTGQDGFRLLIDEDAFKRTVKEASRETRSITSDFIQLKHLSFLEEEVESRGSFHFQRENKLRWEYFEPFSYLILIAGDTAVIQSGNNTQVYGVESGRMVKQINDIMISLVSGSILESKDFDFEYYENDTAYKLVLLPQDMNMKEFLNGIILFLNKEDITVDELYMDERSGDFTRIRFVNKKLNAEIPDHIFNIP